MSIHSAIARSAQIGRPRQRDIHRDLAARQVGSTDSFFAGDSATEYVIEFTGLTNNGDGTATASTKICRNQFIGDELLVEIEWSVSVDGALIHTENIGIPTECPGGATESLTFSDGSAGSNVTMAITCANQSCDSAIVSATIPEDVADFQFGFFDPVREVTAGEGAAQVATFHWEHIQNDGVGLTGELARLDSFGSPLNILCQQPASSSNIGDTWGLSLIEGSDGTAECGSLLHNGNVTQDDALADIPDNPGGQIHFGLRVWSDVENAPSYPPPGSSSARAVSWSADIVSSIDPALVFVDGCSFTPSNPTLDEQVTYDATIRNDNSVDAITDCVFTLSVPNQGDPIVARVDDITITAGGTTSITVSRALNNPISDTDNAIQEGLTADVVAATVNEAEF